jgi:hypothetical protein
MLRKQLIGVTLAGAMVSGLAGCASHAGTGALVGGATGAGIGAIAGHNTGSGHTAGGALIGGAIGAITGAAIGSAGDAAERRDYENRSDDRRYYERDDYRDYRHAPPPPPRHERYESRRYDPCCDDGYDEYRSYRRYGY